MARLKDWFFWKDKKGLAEAMTEYYPGIFSKDPILSFARMQILSSELTIDARMRQLSKEEEDEE